MFMVESNILCEATMKSVVCIIINCSLEKKNNIQIRNSTAEFLIFQLEVVCRKFRRTTQTKKSSAQKHHNAEDTAILYYIDGYTIDRKLSTIFSTYKLFFKKIHLRVNSCSTDAFVCCIYHLPSKISNIWHKNTITLNIQHPYNI